MSGSDDEKKESTVGWVYKLDTKSVVEEFQKRNITVDISKTLATLRKELKEVVRQEIEAREAAKTEKKTDASGVLEKDNSELNASNESFESAEGTESTKNETEKVLRNVSADDTKKGSDVGAPYAESDDDDNMAGDNNKLEFCLGKDDWDLFVERLELLFAMKDIAENKQHIWLLTRLDEEAYKLAKSLCAPILPKDKKYADLKTLMQGHLKPKPSEVMERCTFAQAKQQQNESVAEFEARLRRLALNCNFTSLDTALRDQFVVGIRDEETRISLFRDPKLTFANALKEAVARESAVKNATDATCALDKKNTQREVFTFRGNPKGGKQRSKQHQQRRDKPSNAQRDRREKNTNSGCFCCGKANHVRAECRHRDKKCNFCKTIGHLEGVCYKKKEQQPEGSSVHKLDESSRSEEEEQRSHEDEFYSIDVVNNGHEYVYADACVNESGARAEPMNVDLCVNGKNVSMELDTGMFATVISESEKNKFFKNEKIIKTDVKLRTYDDKVLRPLGKLVDLQVKFNGKERTLYCFVLPGDGPMLIGRQWLAAHGCWPLTLEKDNGKGHFLNKINLEKIKEYFFEKYKDLFSDEPGLYNKSKVTIHLTDKARPIATKCRPVPHATRPDVDKEIERLVGLGHLKEVDTSEWATPIVPAYKGNGKLRICGDFKLTINPFIIIDNYPLHTIDDIFTVLQGGVYYTELDLFHCYMQFGLDEESSKLLTIVTQKGLYRYTKLQEGIASAPANVQKKMDECLRGIEGTIAYIDNIYIMGRNKEECSERTEKVLDRLKENGLKLNKKCKFLNERIEVLGFVIDKDGLHKARSKVEAMISAPKPQNFKELHSFLGLVNFYARFLENRSDNMKPLYDCANAKEFKWNENCDKAFRWVKNELISPRVLANYDPKEKIVLACDASSYGLSAILSHKYKDGSEKPIAYASKKIAKKELNRTILDKEAMAIIFGFKRFYQFVYGRDIILRTDNQPLQLILGPRRGIPATANNRLQRWAYYLSGFRYTVEYIKSKDNANCDALSRLPIEDETELLENNFSPLNFFKNGFDTFDSKMLAKKSITDETILKVIKYTLSSWPDPKDLSEGEKEYYSRRLEYTVDNKCLFWGLRAVIPESMRPLMLKELHASHMGIVKIKMLARSYVWWPGIDRDIEDYVKACTTCLVEQKKPPHTPLTTWPWPDRAWHRIHCDFLGPFYGDMYLVLIDAHTKWPEVINFKNNTKAYRVVEEFKNLFARFGMPFHAVTDGGPQFRATEFLSFLEQNGVHHSFSPPYHPATNGAAENFVETFKDKVHKIVKGGEKPADAVNLFLIDYRSIEHCTTGKSPAQLMYKRELRTRFDLLRTSVSARVEQQQRAQIVSRSGKRKNDIEEGDIVAFDNHATRGEKRIVGEIVKQVSPSTFVVKDSDNVKQKRHVDQMIKRPNLRRSPRLNACLKKAEDCDVCE
ncbi:uncharacterized protein K02A2.6-like [Neodiprion virginianus]|uniref:uncharacterized protein K02A2.6-like n=1 Tax=Neodiprion virginianus TaxID=2961670 RepID=UPI001EE69F73|nr:uncharacterized protein K02A2.6-like [Neodiprion virginianus]